LEITGDFGGDAARAIEFGGDHFLGIGRSLIAGQAELPRHPQAEQPVAPGLGLEFQLLVDGKLLLKALFAFVECGHCYDSNSGKWRRGWSVATTPRLLR